MNNGKGKSIDIKTQIENIRTKTLNQLLSEGWQDLTHPEMAYWTTSRDIYNPETGLKVRYDKGVEGADGFEGGK